MRRCTAGHGGSCYRRGADGTVLDPPLPGRAEQSLLAMFLPILIPIGIS